MAAGIVKFFAPLVGKVVVVSGTLSGGHTIIGICEGASAAGHVVLKDVAHAQRLPGAGYVYEPSMTGRGPCSISASAWATLGEADKQMSLHYEQWKKHYYQEKDPQ